MSEELIPLSERTLNAPLMDQSVLAEGAKPERDDETYSSDERGLSRAANDFTEARDERTPKTNYRRGVDSVDEMPILAYTSEDKSPLSIKQAAKDLTWSRDYLLNHAKAADGEDVTDAVDVALRRSMFDEPADAPPAREIKLSDGDPELKELGRSVDPVKDGMTQAEALERLANLRQQEADARASELSQLTEEPAYQQEEQEQPAEPEQPQETPEQAAARQHYEQALVAERARQAQQQQVDQAEANAKQRLAALTQEAQAHFPEVVTMQELETLRVQNPQRHAALMQYNEAARQARDVLDKVAQHRQQTSVEAVAQQRAQQVARRVEWNRKADEVATAEIQKAIPSVPFTEIQKAARDMFREMGVDEAGLRRHWEGEPMNFRHPHVQRIVAEAAMYRRMQAKAATVRATPQPIPPSLRPGTAGQVVASQDSTVTELKRQIAGARGKKAMELGTKLLQAQRAARGNR